jgi:hypothetical protein
VTSAGTRRPISTDPQKLPRSVRSERRRAARAEARVERARVKQEKADAKAEARSAKAASKATSEAGAAPRSGEQSRDASATAPEGRAGIGLIESLHFRLPRISLPGSGPEEIDLRDPAVHPRIAGRREEVRTEQRQSRSRIRMLALAVAVALTVAVAVLFSPLFDMDHLLVEGVEGAPAAQVSEASGLDGGPALFSIDASEVRDRIESLGWVAHAVVRIRWPDRVEVLVTPHRPVANVAVGDDDPAALATASGRVLSYEEAGPLLAFSGGLPVVRTQDDPLRTGDGAEPGRAAPALAEALLALDMLGPATMSAVGEMRSGDEGLTLSLAAGPAAGAQVALGPPQGLPEKAQAAEAVLSGTVELRCMERLDVSVPSRTIIQRVAGCDLPPVEQVEDR